MYCSVGRFAVVRYDTLVARSYIRKVLSVSLMLNMAACIVNKERGNGIGWLERSGQRVSGEEGGPPILFQ